MKNKFFQSLFSIAQIAFIVLFLSMQKMAIVTWLAVGFIFLSAFLNLFLLYRGIKKIDKKENKN